MTSGAFPSFRLPAALFRAASTQSAESPRRLAPQAEPEWSRLTFDPTRDDDLFDWLGFSSARD
jgi:hypothetical protein